MLSKFFSFFLLAMVAGFSAAHAQQVIKGRINDENGQPLIGATVYLTAEQKATATDVNGNFSITSHIKTNSVRISFISYKTQERALESFKDFTTINLDKEGSKLDEVVVVGYGTTAKKDLTGAVSTLSGNLISDRKVTQLTQALQGAIPGVAVTRTSGAPGSSGTILIRGVTTLGSNAPLVIIDGVPGQLDNVNPDDVENISILKDAASSAIYGSRAAAGVILVTTKRAKEGQATITYNGDYGWDKATMMPTYVDAPTYMRLFNEMKVNDGAAPVYDPAVIQNFAALHAADPDKYPNTDWQKDFFKNMAFHQQHDVDISVGTPNVKTKVMAGYLNEASLEPGRSFNRYSLRVNNDLRITDKLDANVDISYRRTAYITPSRSNVGGLRLLPAVYDDFYSDGRYAPGKDGENELALNALGGTSDTRYNKFSSRLQLNYNPVKGLKLSAIVAPQLNFSNSNSFSKMISYTSLADPSVIINTSGNTNSLTQTQTYEQDINMQALANYQVTIARDHNITALLGFEDNTFHNENTGEYRDGYVLPDYQVLDAGSKTNATNNGNADESALRSFFGRVTYNYKGKYLLQANARYDGSSRFAAATRWGFFPSVSAGWVVTEEEAFKDKLPFSFLKVRGSWGRNGNQEIGNYSYQSLISLSSVLFYNSAGQITPVTGGNQLYYALKDISWETKQDFDLGVDMAFLNNRLSVTADYFDKKTFDILLNLPIPLNTGLLATSQNAGTMLNKGWELQVGWNDKLDKNWKYNVSVNLSDYTNKIVDLKGTSTLGAQALLEDQPYNVWYGYQALGYFKDAADVTASAKLTGGEKPGDIKYRDMNGDGKITADKDQVPLGNSLPRYLYGGNAGISYKNIDFGCSFQGVGKQTGKLTADMVQPFQGNYGNVKTSYLGNYWTPDNPNAKYPRLSYTNVNVNYSPNSNFWLFNAAYFRLKDIRLGYTFNPALLKHIGIKKARVFVAATDAFTVSNYPKGWDPEGTRADNSIVATYYTGVSLTF
jgi:TonB-linked SusC/RagA family outer membrane protein